MELTTLETLIITYTPLLTTIIAIITAFCKMVAAMQKLKLSNDKEREELKTTLNNVLQDNAQLKKTLNEAMTKIDNIGRK